MKNILFFFSILGVNRIVFTNRLCCLWVRCHGDRFSITPNALSQNLAKHRRARIGVKSFSFVLKCSRRRHQGCCAAVLLAEFQRNMTVSTTNIGVTRLCKIISCRIFSWFHYLNQWWYMLPMHACVSRPKWVNNWMDSNFIFLQYECSCHVK